MRLLHRSRHIVVTLLVSAGALAPAPLASQAAAARPAQAPPAGSAAEAWWRHVQVLAHDSLKGRDTGSPGHESAVRYIARQFEAAGLEPGGTDGWLQRVEFVEVKLDAERVTLAMRPATGSWVPLAVGRDLRLAPRPSTGDIEAPLVFAGYGLSLPQAGVDDLAGLDVKGKIVVHVNAVPKGLSAALQAHGTRSRWTAMQQAGAVGIIAIGAGGVWNDAGGAGGVAVALADTMLDDTRGQRLNATANPALASRLFVGTALVWDSIVALVRRGDKLPTAALNVTLRATLPTVRRTLSSPNVVGVLPGTDATLRNEIVVYTAHTDHTGTFKGPVLTGDSIFNGAMDNASGAATLIETARLVAKRGGNKRTLAFVGVTAEERGLLGSRYFAAHPSLRNGMVVANLNTDMFLPLIPLTGVFAYGYEESDLADDLDAVTKARGLEVLPDPEPEQNRFVRSDQYSFIRRGIPALAFKVGYRTGTPEEKTWQAWVRDHYHKLSDDITQPVDFTTAAGFNEMYADLALRVANRAKRPAWRPTSFFATPIP
ncbi:M28 family peptidase [Gemmatimonas sp.]|uniref:M28 family peptidase n=1 Tax=Gemmatimonas sp. TaxID=1962908 RepID=UPI0025B97C66|nr:M28 family peptidase [Gemmatimonas sp.]MCA2990722.1 M28 family peptidase [Gemmatimonas sp.]